MSWQLPYGRPTGAILLKPQGASGPLPAILGLHDHGGNKYLGKRKITRVSDHMPDFVLEHQEQSYEGLAWANELARRGYVVLVHDAFAFGSRRVMYSDVSGIEWGPCNVEGKSDANPEDPANIELYNSWASEHEHIMSKSLFCGGTTWPGVFLAEDIKALDVLCSRQDVDPERIGCGGLSGGGLRTVYLGGADSRIKCAVCAGFMSTWNDFLLNKSYTHTWMTYAPLLPRYLDFPEILGLRVPLPTLVLNNIDDELYTMQEMTRADKILEEVYEKAGAGHHYTCSFYPGPHKMDARMQKEAFSWYDRWLK
jgi:dienelactone hydrolase